MTTTQGEQEIKKNLKEATSLLELIDIDDEKLETIISKLPLSVKDNPGVQSLILKLVKPGNDDESPLDFTRLNALLETDEMLPLLSGVLKELSGNPEIIEKFEKDILPILFSS